MATDSTAVTAMIVPPEPVSTLAVTSTFLLKTAVAQVKTDGIHVEANILFDEGAQRSFMSEKLAKTLRIVPHTSECVSVSAFGAKLSSSSELGVEQSMS